MPPFLRRGRREKLIDTMAMYKFNFLHFHVSDDQGFRLRIDALPKLHRVGSVRKSTCGDGKPHGGYYTKAQIKEIVDYAAERYIQILPEIDIPGHTRAVIAAYPELSCSGKPTDVATWFGIHSKVLCAGKEKVYEALDVILRKWRKCSPANTSIWAATRSRNSNGRSVPTAPKPYVERG